MTGVVSEADLERADKLGTLTMERRRIVAEEFAAHRIASVCEALEELEAALPDDIDLFRVIRAAGRSDRAKAQAVAAILPNFPTARANLKGAGA